MDYRIDLELSQYNSRPHLRLRIEMNYIVHVSNVSKKVLKGRNPI